MAVLGGPSDSSNARLTKETLGKNDGVVHVTLDTPHYDWTELDKNCLKTLCPALLEALEKADSYVDFASYDTDGNGSLEKNEAALGFVVAGYEAAAADDNSPYDPNKYLWSHAYDIKMGSFMRDSIRQRSTSNSIRRWSHPI